MPLLLFGLVVFKAWVDGEVVLAALTSSEDVKVTLEELQPIFARIQRMVIERYHSSFLLY